MCIYRQAFHIQVQVQCSDDQTSRPFHTQVNAEQRRGATDSLSSSFYSVTHPSSFVSPHFYAHIWNIITDLTENASPFTRVEFHRRRDRAVSLRSSFMAPIWTSRECIVGQLSRQAHGSDGVQSVISLGPDWDSEVWILLGRQITNRMLLSSQR